MPASPFRTFLLIDEVLLIVLSLLDRYVPKSFPLKRITSPARTFISMNTASLVSVAVFFVKPTTLWQLTKVKVRQ
jgi:hypothetical protein